MSKFKVGDICKSAIYYDIVKIIEVNQTSYKVECVTKSRDIERGNDHVVPGYKALVNIVSADYYFEIANDYILDRKLECLEELE